MQSDAESAEILLRAKPSTISNFAAAGHAPWMVVTTIFAGVAILKIGRNCPKLKKWRTITDWLDSGFRGWRCPLLIRVCWSVI